MRHDPEFDPDHEDAAYAAYSDQEYQAAHDKLLMSLQDAPASEMLDRSLAQVQQLGHLLRAAHEVATYREHGVKPAFGFCSTCGERVQWQRKWTHVQRNPDTHRYEAIATDCTPTALLLMSDPDDEDLVF